MRTGALTPFGDLHNYRAPPPPFLPEITGAMWPWPRCYMATRRPELNQLSASSMGMHDPPAVTGVSGLIIGSGGPSGDGIYDAKAAEYRLHTSVALRPGDQVYLQYGCYTNLELLGNHLETSQALHQHDL